MRLNFLKAGRIMHMGNVIKAVGMPVRSNFQTEILIALCNKKECQLVDESYMYITWIFSASANVQWKL